MLVPGSCRYEMGGLGRIWAGTVGQYRFLQIEGVTLASALRCRHRGVMPVWPFGPCALNHGFSAFAVLGLVVWLVIVHRSPCFCLTVRASASRSTGPFLELCEGLLSSHSRCRPFLSHGLPCPLRHSHWRPLGGGGAHCERRAGGSPKPPTAPQRPDNRSKNGEDIALRPGGTTNPRMTRTTIDL